MNKKFGLFIGALLLFGVILTGCASSADEVALATRSQMVHWCEREFGVEPTVVSSEKGKSEVTYVMEDPEKGFTYSAKTYATSTGMDGSTFWWHEEKHSDFGDVYQSYFAEQYKEKIEAIETKYNIALSFEPYIYLARIEGSDSESIKSACDEFLALVVEYDTRGFWKEMKTVLYSAGEYLGYVSEAETYVDADTEYWQWMLQIASEEMHVNVNRLKFVTTEVRTVDRIVGYDPNKLAHILGTDNDTRQESVVVHFDFDGEHYWICDLVVYDEDTGALVHLGNHLIK